MLLIVNTKKKKHEENINYYLLYNLGEPKVTKQIVFNKKKLIKEILEIYQS